MNAISDDEVITRIGGNITRLLEKRCWTQRILAHRSGESEQRISNIVCGTREPRSGFVFRIAKAFGVSIDELFKPVKNSSGN